MARGSPFLLIATAWRFLLSLSGMMHEPSLEGESRCQSWSVVAEMGEYQRSDVQQESDCEDSDSFTTSAVFLCLSCGYEVDVRHHICPTCHKVLTLFEHGADSEQQPRSPSVFSDNTLIDSSQSGSSQHEQSIVHEPQVEHSIAISWL